jgi:hypothetical protein
MSLKKRMPIAAFGLMLAGAAGSVLGQYSTPMRDVENPDRFPYQERGSGSINANFLNTFITFPTPTGKRYILEYVSVDCSTPSASDSFTSVFLTVTKITSPTSTEGYSVANIAMERRGPSPFGGYTWAGSAQFKAYSDYNPFASGGGNGIALNIFHTDTSVSANCTGVVTGHTITP